MTMAGRFSMYSGQFNNLLVREDYITYVSVIPARIEKIKPVADDGSDCQMAVKYTTNIKLSPAVMGALGMGNFQRMNWSRYTIRLVSSMRHYPEVRKRCFAMSLDTACRLSITLVALPNDRMFSVIPNAVRVQLVGTIKAISVKSPWLHRT